MAESQFACTNCGQPFTAEPDVSGIITCPHCKAQFIVELPAEKAQTQTVGVSADELPSEQTALPPGTDVNGFEVVRLVGLGGMGSVYLAIQKSMQREVALKLLNPNVTRDAEAVQQFLNEVRNSGKLQHPNIVAAYDAGEYNGNYYLAMQFVKGDTLDNIIEKNGPLTELRALEVISQIATALDYVWTKFNMFHRDIKPGNFMLNEDNAAMLMDMGIAQGLGEWHPDGAIEGSPYYMSPEQIRGEQLAWTTDQYSLGASLFQLIAGKTPYDADSIEDILKQHCSAPTPKIEERAPGIHVSASTQALIEKMMEKMPSKRFSSWKALIKQVNSIIASMTSSKPKLSLKLNLPPQQPQKQEAPAEKPKKSFNFKKLFLILGIVVLVLAVIGGAFGGFAWYRGNVNSAFNEKFKLWEAAAKEFPKDTDSAEKFSAALTDVQKSASPEFMLSADAKSKLEKARKDTEAALKKAEEDNKKFDADLAKANADFTAIKKSFESDQAAKKLNLNSVRDRLKKLLDIKKAADLKTMSKSRAEKIVKLKKEIADFEKVLRETEKKLIPKPKPQPKKPAPRPQPKQQQRKPAPRPQPKQQPKKPAPRPQPKKTAPRPLNLTQASHQFRALAARKAADAFIQHNYGIMKSLQIPPQLRKARPNPKNKQETDAYNMAMKTYRTLYKYAVNAEKVWNAMNAHPETIQLKNPLITVYIKGMQGSFSFRSFSKGLVQAGNKKVPFSDIAGKSKFEIALSVVNNKKNKLDGNALAGFLVAEMVPPYIVGKVIQDTSQQREYIIAFGECFKVVKQYANRNPNMKNRLMADFGALYNKLGK